MKTLYAETIKCLKDHEKSWGDVVAVCGKEFRISKEQFKELANTYYDRGFGAPEVATDLVVVGEDFWIERHEYDGSEWWEFKTIPKHQNLPIKSINALTVNQSDKDDLVGWCTLKELNEIGGGSYG